MSPVLLPQDLNQLHVAGRRTQARRGQQSLKEKGTAVAQTKHSVDPGLVFRRAIPAHHRATPTGLSGGIVCAVPSPSEHGETR